MSENKLIAKLSGPKLRLALVHSLGLDYEISIEPAYGVGSRVLLKGQCEFFRPDQDWKQAAPLIEANWSQIALWLQIYFGPTWVGYVDRSTDSVLVWFMRAIVGHYNPTLTSVPFDKLIESKT